MNTAEDASEMNLFFNYFDCHDFSRKHRQIHNVLNKPSAEDDYFRKACTSEDEVRRAFHHANPSKALGADNIGP